MYQRGARVEAGGLVNTLLPEKYKKYWLCVCMLRHVVLEKSNYFTAGLMEIEMKTD